VHFPILVVLRRAFDAAQVSQWPLVAQLMVYLATIGLVIAVAAVLFYTVERPARTRLRDRMGVLHG
jgi:peptidoglycan/LPS O-acetylase OafA/YrhL